MKSFGRSIGLLAALGITLAARGASAAGDPYLEWWTIHAPHARVHYYKGLEPIAERVTDIIEGMHESMAHEMGWAPDSKTEIVITDNSDSANGSATAFPYTTVRLFVTAPDDMSPLGDYDDWYLGLVTHEYSHILHTDNISGVPAIVNAVLGRTMVPNQAQPRWILEGIATINESRHTTGGRMRSSMFDMYLRADVIDGRVVPLDQMTHQPRRWPQGNIWYLYGSRFLGWIADVYGYNTLAAIARDTGSQLVPYGINRTMRRATGATYEQLYKAWVEHLRVHYNEQLEKVRARGLREGTRLTHHGNSLGHPRWVPQHARRSGAWAELVYHRSNMHGRSGLYRLVLDSPTQVREEQLLARTSGETSASFSPDGALYYDSLQPWRRLYFFSDLMRLAPGKSAPSGLEPWALRLTHGHRAAEPDVSPDGRSIVFVVSHRGTRYLKIADLTTEGALVNERGLVPSARFEQVFSPRFSPDGRFVAYSAWTTGGFRDIRIVDVETGQVTQLMRDRAMDMGPSFSDDGRYLLFSSDRTGISNIYAYDRQERKTFQVTNVRTGAYQPQLSADGKTLVYVGYTSHGFDLYSMAFEPSQFLEAPEPLVERDEPQLPPPRRKYEKRPYNPLPSLRPRALTLQYGPGTYGQALTVQTQGTDAVGHHSIIASATFETEEPVPYASLSYSYGRLPFNFNSTIFRSLAPRTGYRINNQEPVWLERTLGWTNGITYSKPGAFESQSYGLTYSLANVDGDLPVGRDLDPYSYTVIDPFCGYVGVVRLAWSYGNAEQFLYSVGPERGFYLSASVDMGNELTASQYSVYAFSYQATGYVPLPWLSHHTLALHAGGATSTGNYPRRGLYHVGGFVDTTMQDVFNNTIFQGGFVLRGYEPVSFIGSQYHLFNAEYRFPIVNVDRGLSTLPAFLHRLNGALFIDYGGAFDKLDVENWRDQFHTGIGAELWTELTLAYYTTLNLRLGYARGFGEFAEPGGQKYLVVAAPF